MERKVFTHLISPEARRLHDTLSQGGFRRSQNIAYRPACDGCNACVSVRVPVDGFAWTRSFRRTLERNRDLAGAMVPAHATAEHYSLFRAYIDSRHNDGGMSDMTVLDFAAMVDESFVETRLIEYRLAGGGLVACVLSDVLEDGLSMIYSFYEPEQPRRGLGTCMVLDHIRRAHAMGLPYVYLGYWVDGSPKMDYKARFLPQERLEQTGWRRVER